LYSSVRVIYPAVPNHSARIAVEVLLDAEGTAAEESLVQASSVDFERLKTQIAEYIPFELQSDEALDIWSTGRGGEDVR